MSFSRLQPWKWFSIIHTWLNCIVFLLFLCFYCTITILLPWYGKSWVGQSRTARCKFVFVKGWRAHGHIQHTLKYSSIETFKTYLSMEWNRNYTDWLADCLARIAIMLVFPIIKMIKKKTLQTQKNFIPLNYSHHTEDREFLPRVLQTH